MIELEPPDLDTKFLPGKLYKANQKVATLTADSDWLEGSIKSARATADAPYSPEALVDAILAGDTTLRLKLKSEIAKRITRIDIHFNSRYQNDLSHFVDGDGVVAEIRFVNGWTIPFGL